MYEYPLTSSDTSLNVVPPNDNEDWNIIPGAMFRPALEAAELPAERRLVFMYNRELI